MAVLNRKTGGQPGRLPWYNCKCPHSSNPLFNGFLVMNAKLLLIVWGITVGAYALADEIEQPSEARRSSYGDKDGPAKAAAVTALRDAAPARPLQKVKTASPESIVRWIKQLDSDEYWTREDATKRLFLAGAEAVGPLGEAAQARSWRSARARLACWHVF